MRLLRFRIIRDFLRGVGANWIARLGVGLATSSFVVFLFLEVLMLTGAIVNPYFGMIVFLTFPVLIGAGLVLTALGWYLYRRTQRKLGLSERALLKKRFHESYLEPRAFGSRIAWIVIGVSAVSVLFLLGVTGQTLHFMDQPTFCGKTCHVMNPQWTVYQDSPHRNVACVNCHVGEGMEALVQSKMDGLRQTVLEMRGVYSRPIPTPVHQLRPSDETCGRCHWASDDHGDVVKVLRHYQNDEAATLLYNTVSLKVGSGRGERGVIHWHASKQARIRYASVGDARNEILWVEVENEHGEARRYVNRKRNIVRQATGDEHIRLMDCTDCHNRVAHIFEQPDQGIDDRIANGAIDRSLPFVRAKALAAVSHDYPTKEAALEGIGKNLRGFYRVAYPEISTAKAVEIDRAVQSLQDFYARNIHPAMKVSWKTYANHRGHDAPGTGCLRCHNREMVDEEGDALAHECTLCHSIFAHESKEPFVFQRNPGEREEVDATTAEHAFLWLEYRNRLEPPGRDLEVAAK